MAVILDSAKEILQLHFFTSKFPTKLSINKNIQLFKKSRLNNPQFVYMKNKLSCVVWG